MGFYGSKKKDEYHVGDTVHIDPQKRIFGFAYKKNVWLFYPLNKPMGKDIAQITCSPNTYIYLATNSNSSNAGLWSGENISSISASFYGDDRSTILITASLTDAIASAQTAVEFFSLTGPLTE